MTKELWRAVYDFCSVWGFYNPLDLVRHLKSQGQIALHDTAEDLHKYPDKKTYQGMIKFLVGVVG